MDIERILSQPTVYENVHESIFRSYHILDKVMEMIERGDSKESIKEIVAYLKEPNKN